MIQIFALWYYCHFWQKIILFNLQVFISCVLNFRKKKTPFTKKKRDLVMGFQYHTVLNMYDTKSYIMIYWVFCLKLNFAKNFHFLWFMTEFFFYISLLYTQSLSLRNASSNSLIITTKKKCQKADNLIKTSNSNQTIVVL